MELAFDSQQQDELDSIEGKLRYYRVGCFPFELFIARIAVSFRDSLIDLISHSSQL